jgi:hypothetical protein
MATTEDLGTSPSGQVLLAGSSVLLAGSGDDFVAAADGEQDLVLCGPGVDTVSVDPVDLVSRDCEAVYPD